MVREVAFAGSMRRKLIEWLNGLDLPRHLGINDCEQLFEDRADLLHATSLFRYPVINKGKDYSGESPKPHRSEMLRAFMDAFVTRELPRVHPDAYIIPLGKPPSVQLGEAARARKLNSYRFLGGGVQRSEPRWHFLHPSQILGAQDRQATFDRHKAEMREMVAEWFAHHPAQSTGLGGAELKEI